MKVMIIYFVGVCFFTLVQFYPQTDSTQAEQFTPSCLNSLKID